MKIQFVQDFKILENYKTEWNNLARNNETNTVFQLFEWHKSWWQNYGDAYELCTILVFQETKLVAIAPLSMKKTGFNDVVIQFIGEGRSDYCDFIVPENKNEIINEILNFFFINFISWTSMSLNHIPNYSSTKEIVSEINRKNKRNYFSKDVNSCPALVLSDRDEILNLLNKKTLRRRYNYFKKNGNLKFFHINSLENIKEHFPIFFEQHIERTNLKNQKSLFLTEQNKNFYKSIIDNMYADNRVRFSCLTFNEIPIAYHFGFEYANKLIWYKPSFNIDFFSKSPGTVLLKFLIEYALEKNLDEFDFTIGDEKFKDRFSNKKGKNIQIEIYNSEIRFQLKLIVSKFRKIIKRVIK